MSKNSPEPEVYFPDKNSSKEERELGIKIIDDRLNEPNMVDHKSRPSFLKKGKGKGSDVRKVQPEA